jgi:signal transduction histidine kinase
MNIQEIFHYTVAAFCLLLGLTAYIKDPRGRLWQTRVLFAAGTIGAGFGYLLIASGAIKQELWLIVMNVFPVASLAFNALVFQALRRPASRVTVISVIVMVFVLYPLLFTVAHVTSGYPGRFALAHLFFVGFTVWQLIELTALARSTSSTQVYIIICSVCLELGFILVRGFSWLGQDVSSVVSILNEPLTTEYIRLAWVTTHVATFISTLGYIQEQLSRDSTRLNALVMQKERLLRMMMSVVSGSLSKISAPALVHELSQPLAALRINVDYLQKNNPGAGGEDVWGAVQSDIGRLAQRLDTIRSLSEAPDLSERLDLKSILNSMWLDLRSQSPKIDYQFRDDIRATERMMIQGSRELIEIVFQNLFDNALRALSDCGRPALELRLWVTDQQAHVCISDNGPGFSRAALLHARELGFSSTQSGTGFGLWLAHRIIGEHRGTLSFSNRDTGGAQVEVSLPLAKP